MHHQIGSHLQLEWLGVRAALLDYSSGSWILLRHPGG